MFSNVWAQLQSNYFLENISVVDSAPVAFRRRSSDVTKPNSYELQP